MPLTSRTLANIVGLNTEASPIDPTAMPPNSLLDCRNITFSKAGQVVARKGQPVYWDLFNASSPYTLRTLAPATADESGNFYGFGQSASNGGQAVSLATNASYSESVMAYFTGAITAGVRSVGRPTAADRPMDTAEFTSFSPRTWFSQGKLYCSSKNGIFRQEPTGDLRRVTTAVPAITATGFTTSGTEEAWLGTGYVCRIVCVLVEYFEDGTFVESPISSEAVVENVSFAAIPTISWRVDCHNIRDLSRTYLEVYRTASYKMGDAPEVEFKKCRAVPLDNTTYVQINGSNGDVYESKIVLPLPANNDLILASETLYASPNGDGGTYYVNCPPPAANDVTVFKDYTVYAGLKRVPFIQVTATGFGAGTAGTFQVKTASGGTTVTTTLTLQANSTSDPSSAGQMSAADYTFKGTRSVPVVLTIRPVNPASPGSEKCVVPYYAEVAYKLFRTAQTDGNIVRIKPTTGKFDLDRFVSPKGCFAVVDGLGIVRDIVTYDDYEQIPGTNGYIEFYGAQSKSGFDTGGSGVTSGCWDATSPTNTAAPATAYYLYPLSTADTNNLPIYPISTDASGATLYQGYSLLPTFYQYPAIPFMQIPVGVVGSATYSTSSRTISVRPVFFGLLWKDVAVRLDRSVKALVQDHNTSRTYKSPYMVYTGEALKFVVVGTFPGSHTLANTETNSGNYDAIFLNTASSSTFTYDENITSSSGTVNFSEDVSIPNGLVFSKRNRSECVPLSGILAPEKVGQDNYRIQRVAVNNDQLYVFKDKEGIFRVQIVEGTVVPQVSATSVVDNTVWLVGDDALQELQESIYFLSNKGVVRLNNGQLINISRSIESQIKDALSRESDPNNIKSFKNEYRRHFGLYFPTADKCFVFDTFTEQWSIWDTPFTASYGRADGRLMLAKDVPLYNSSGNAVTRQVVVRDSYVGGGWDAAADQYDLSVAVTTPSTGNTAVFTSGASATTYLGNIAGISTMFDMTQDKVYYLAGGIYYPMTYVSVDAVAKTATFTLDNSASLSSPSSGQLVIGVNSKIVMNRFWASSSPGVTFEGTVTPSSPQGAMTLAQFAECALHTIGSHTNLKVAFETDVSSLDFSASVSPESYSVTLPSFYDTIRVAVPRNQARGRWISVEVKHDYPLEKFTIAGLGWTFKDSNTYRMKARIT